MASCDIPEFRALTNKVRDAMQRAGDAATLAAHEVDLAESVTDLEASLSGLLESEG